ncbi:hypothetical protein Plhal703r1_c42g0142711 [Plasmopara halstedii]
MPSKLMCRNLKSRGQVLASRGLRTGSECESSEISEESKLSDDRNGLEPAISGSAVFWKPHKARRIIRRLFATLITWVSSSPPVVNRAGAKGGLIVRLCCLLLLPKNQVHTIMVKPRGSVEDSFTLRATCMPSKPMLGWTRRCGTTFYEHNMGGLLVQKRWSTEPSRRQL